MISYASKVKVCDVFYDMIQRKNWATFYQELLLITNVLINIKLVNSSVKLISFWKGNVTYKSLTYER